MHYRHLVCLPCTGSPMQIMRHLAIAAPRSLISKCWDPHYNFWTNRDICFKFGTDIEDGLLLRPDHKTTPKWAWPESRDLISKFWDPPYNFGTNRDLRFKFGTDIDDRPLLRPDHKMTLSGRGLGHVTKFCTQRTNCLPASWCYIKCKWYVY